MFKVISFIPGEDVLVKNAELKAVVNAVTIDRESVSYECQWWIDGECRTMSFFESELVALTVHDAVEIGVIK